MSEEKRGGARILVLYHSIYGHIETMAQSIAEGARSVPGVEVTVKRVPETMDPEAFKAAGGKTGQSAPVASAAELADYDAIILGTPTRFGNMTGQMRNSSIRPAAYGPKAHWQVRSPACSAQP